MAQPQDIKTEIEVLDTSQSTEHRGSDLVADLIKFLTSLYLGVLLLWWRWDEMLHEAPFWRTFLVCGTARLFVQLLWRAYFHRDLKFWV